MELVNLLAEAYADSHTSPDEGLLQEIADQTNASHPHAHMLSGHVQGRLLSFLSRLLQPRTILEIGTFTGYSALCLAEGLHAEGQLHTIEIRESDALQAQENFHKSNAGKQVTLHTGNALEIIPALPFSWDLVFIDADKTAYIDYYEMVVPRLSEKGMIIADNVLFHGQVLEPEIKGKNAKAIHAFNAHVAADNRTEQVLLTVRDGLMLIKKK
ncbi:MAG: O-methyltransferase [Chitinophagaceae bacterium]|nr:O-methyltransferase [Chitinophagaceae bacterium]